MSIVSMLGLALPLQGGNAWTEAENAALTAIMAAGDKRARRDWDAVAASPDLSGRSAVCIRPRAQL